MSPNGQGIAQSNTPFDPQKLLKLQRAISFDKLLKQVKPGVVHSEFRPLGQNSVQFTLEALDPQRFIKGFVVVNPVIGKGVVVVNGAKVDITIVVALSACVFEVDVVMGDMVPLTVVDTFVGKITEVSVEVLEGTTGGGFE